MQLLVIIQTNELMTAKFITGHTDAEVIEGSIAGCRCHEPF
jgi:hypothetical protein